MWVTDHRFSILGTTIRLRTQAPEMADSMALLFEDFEQTTRAARATNTLQVVAGADGDMRLHQDCMLISTEAEALDLIPAAVAVINRLVLTACTSFAIHASVVELGNRTIAFPAESGGGKTTLSAAMLQQGAKFVSDEALVVDSDRKVIRYPKPLALSEWSAKQLGLTGTAEETLYRAQDLGADTADTGGEVTDIVMAEFDADELSLEPLPRNQAVLGLLEHSFNHFKNPGEAFRLATELAATSDVWSLGYDDPNTAAQLIAAELS